MQTRRAQVVNPTPRYTLGRPRGRLAATPPAGPLLAVLAGGLCAGCALAPPPAPPELAEASPELPADFAGSAEAGAHRPLEWWRAFGDPALDGVVESVLASNLDIAEAVARVEQARVRARRAGAAALPVVRAGAGVDSFDVPINAGIGAQLGELGLDEVFGGADGGFTLPDRIGLTTYSLYADFAYELDFWGRVRHASLAAGADLLASAADVHAARIGVLTETITAYFDIVASRRQIAIADEMVSALGEREQLAETRYDRGLTDSLDLYRVRQDLRDTQAGLPRLDAGLAAAEARLAVLLGGWRDDVAELLPDSLSPGGIAGRVPAGVPADLLVQRPDVLAARLRLEAAAHDIGARRAELMPSLSLSGAVGLQTTGIGGLFNVQQWFSNASHAPVRAPSLLYGDLDARTHRFVLVLEDLGGMEAIPQSAGVGVDRARRAIREIAGFQGRFWEAADDPALAACGAFLTAGQRRIMQTLYLLTLPLAFERFGDLFTTGARRLAEAFGPRIDAHFTAVAKGPKTIVHGDYRGDNVLFGREGQGDFAVLDWQGCGIGCGMYDVAFFLATSVTVDDRRRVERDAVGEYHDIVRRMGAEHCSRDDCWRSYRRNMLGTLMPMVLGSGGIDMSDEALRSQTRELLGRTLTAIEDLNAGELLPPREGLFSSTGAFSLLSRCCYQAYRRLLGMRRRSGS